MLAEQDVDEDLRDAAMILHCYARLLGRIAVVVRILLPALPEARGV